mmetsp:Transcript_19352/g.36428  ORF Transcript_19352/g.36428 Transcript_19352/m.36428 type:complete len:104 (+) Transcript_19352:570-881(+)
MAHAGAKQTAEDISATLVFAQDKKNDLIKFSYGHFVIAQLVIIIVQSGSNDDRCKLASGHRHVYDQQMWCTCTPLRLLCVMIRMITFSTHFKHMYMHNVNDMF